VPPASAPALLSLTPLGLPAPLGAQAKVDKATSLTQLERDTGVS
jgi:hypothetical protein